MEDVSVTKPFKRGVNPASPTPPPMIRHPRHSLKLLSQHSRDTDSSLFDPRTPSQRAAKPAEDENEEPVDAKADHGSVQWAPEAAPVQSSQP